MGKTTRALPTRISERRSTIRTGGERSPVASHLNHAGHNVSALRYVVNSPPRGGDHGKRLLQRETFWIYFLNTMSPNGLNEEFDAISVMCSFFFFNTSIFQLQKLIYAFGPM